MGILTEGDFFFLCPFSQDFFALTALLLSKNVLLGMAVLSYARAVFAKCRALVTGELELPCAKQPSWCRLVLLCDCMAASMGRGHRYDVQAGRCAG